MTSRLAKLIQAFDVVALVSVLSAALLVPIFFMVPYNDEWLRLNYLADHSVWEWTVYHTQTWVVRPTAELIMGFVSLANTRRKLGADFNAHAFLSRFHQMYMWLALTLLGLLYALAAVLAKRWGAWNQWAVLCGCMLICTLMSDEIGYALYWADGYANVVLPFFLMLLGLALMTRGDAWAAPGVLLLMAAALAHEVLCIFSIGYAALTLAFRKFPVHPLRWRALYVGVALLSVALLWAQSFSAGPNARSAAYLQKSGMSYNLAGVWNGLRCIDPLRTALAFLGTLGLIAAAGERLSVPLQRASKHARSNRLYWSLLCAGALLTSLLPLGTVGLKKPKVNVAAYSVATELFVIFGAALFYPLVAAPLAKLFAPYRRWVYSVVPLLLVLAAVSRNVDGYITAVTQFDALRDQARVYTETLFSAQKRARVTRPCHAFIKPNSGMTARTAAEYFRLEKLRELACPK